MVFLFNKKEVPEELPTLAVDELTQENSKEEKNPEKKYKHWPSKNYSSFDKEKITNSSRVDEEEIGFFKDILKAVTEDTKDFDKLDSWYKNEFLNKDIVLQMRQYWEKQSPNMILKNMGGDLKNRLLEKTDKLNKLEKEWQEIYFSLLAKEDEIRKEEKELKESLSEVISIFKKSLGKKKKK